MIFFAALLSQKPVLYINILLGYLTSVPEGGNSTLVVDIGLIGRGGGGIYGKCTTNLFLTNFHFAESISTSKKKKLNKLFANREMFTFSSTVCARLGQVLIFRNSNMALRNNFFCFVIVSYPSSLTRKCQSIPALSLIPGRQTPEV